MKRTIKNQTSSRRFLPTAARALVCMSIGVGALAACGDDDDPMAGMAGAGGMGMAGSAGMGGMAGMGMAGSAGMGGMGMTAGGPLMGMVQDLATGDEFLTATTGAIAGDDIWVAIGQLTARGDDDVDTVLPFKILAVDVEDGSLGTAVELPSDTFYPEGVATAPNGKLFIGSLNDGSIYTVEPGSTTAEEFIAAGTIVQRGVLGLTVGLGGTEGILWFCDSSTDAGTDVSELVGIDIANGTEIGRHSLAPKGDQVAFCNDVLQVGNNLLVSDSFGGRIFMVESGDRIGNSPAEVWLDSDTLVAPPGGPGFGINGLTLVNGWLVVSNNDAGTLLQVMPNSTNPAADIKNIPLMEAGNEVTLCGPDGLSTVEGTSDVIVVENGFCNAGISRVSKVTLSF